MTLGYDTHGITYGAEFSEDLVTWTPITDTGSGTTHTFVLPTSPIRRFARWTIDSP